MCYCRGVMAVDLELTLVEAEALYYAVERPGALTTTGQRALRRALKKLALAIAKTL